MNKKISFGLVIAVLIISYQIAYGQAVHYPSIQSIAKHPLIYKGKREPDKQFFDGRLPHAIGVHSFEVFRANRRHPVNPGPNGLGWTYSHQPYLAYWNGKFYLQFLNDKVGEGIPPSRTVVTTSKDGEHWTRPFTVFPAYPLPQSQIKKWHLPAGTDAAMHQRMGFYVAPNGVLLTSGFYGSGYSAVRGKSPEHGHGIGRVIRQIHKDGSLGPIYFILYNNYNGFNRNNIKRYPYYKTSHNKVFKAACDSLLANPLVRQQWWEEDRGKKNFFAIDPPKVGGGGEAFDFFHRSDGVVIGLWKGSQAALSNNNGKTWTTPIAKDPSMWTPHAKMWGQRLGDGRYALVYDHSATHDNRWPLVVITSKDAHIYRNMLVVDSQVPPTRYHGYAKNRGPQYVRGIIEGNGNPPGKDMWVTYSVNKEDIWVSRIRVPIVGKTSKPVDQSFNKIEDLSELSLWNLYVPKWAPISIKNHIGNKANHYLELKDEAPYDYARASRIFPERRKVTVHFDVNVKQVTDGHGLNVNVDSRNGYRILRLYFSRHLLAFDIKGIQYKAMPFQSDKWNKVTLNINCEKQEYDVKLNNKEYKHIPFASKVDSVSKIVFRTGSYRNYVPSFLLNGNPNLPGLNVQDKPFSGETVPACVYGIDNVEIHKTK